MITLLTLLFLTCNAAFNHTFRYDPVHKHADLPFFWGTLKIGTWNTMMMPWLPYKPLIPTHISQKFDVLALQEVWEGSSVDQILAATRGVYPHHYRPTKRHNVPTIGCDPVPEVLEVAGGFLQCLVGYQVDLPTIIQPILPLPQQCAEIGAYLTLLRQNPADQQCLACLINTLQTVADPNVVFDTCVRGQGARFANGGSSGQLILSKYPIRNVQETPMDSWLLNRINIVATINDIKIGFGHWGFNVMADYGIPGAEFLMYGQTQIDHAKAFVASGVDVALGDFNSGYDYQPDGANFLVQNGYKDLLPAETKTWCDGPKLDWGICVNQGHYSASIDHIFVKDTCTIWGHFNGKWNTDPVQMSDHDGLSATITKWGFSNKQFEHKILAKC
jgi:endonuclease/exonuclease/phosphatase family metal-dependent hydrolase